MRYMGGKFKIAPKFKDFLIAHLDSNSTIWDAFCGGLGFAECFCNYTLICTDVNPYLINLYKGWQQGWRPDFSLINEDMYTFYKNELPENDPMTAFLGIGCSYSGKWFGGYAATCFDIGFMNQRVYYEEAARSLDRFFSKAKKVTFKLVDFLRDINKYPKCDVAYFDPPYINTTGYGFVNNRFDHDKFWTFATTLSSQIPVFVSEQRAPRTWRLLWEKHRKTNSSSVGSSKIIKERLFFRDHLSG